MEGGRAFSREALSAAAAASASLFAPAPAAFLFSVGFFFFFAAACCVGLLLRGVAVAALLPALSMYMAPRPSTAAPAAIAIFMAVDMPVEAVAEAAAAEAGARRDIERRRGRGPRSINGARRSECEGRAAAPGDAITRRSWIL